MGYTGIKLQMAFFFTIYHFFSSLLKARQGKRKKKEDAPGAVLMVDCIAEGRLLPLLSSTHKASVKRANSLMSRMKCYIRLSFC